MPPLEHKQYRPERLVVREASQDGGFRNRRKPATFLWFSPCRAREKAAPEKGKWDWAKWM